MALDIILMGVTYCVHANAIKYMNQATYQTSTCTEACGREAIPRRYFTKEIVV